MSLLIKNINLVDVIKGEIRTADIYIEDGIFKKISEKISARAISKDENMVIINGVGRYAIPGLIDAHTHVELSMLSSASFAEAVLSNGTTAAVLDPHDVVNVLGHKGAKYLMQEMEQTDLTPVWMASPCVPSAPGYEDCYGQIYLDDIKTMIEQYGMHGIAEAMDYDRVISGEDSLSEILSYAREKQLMIDGHAPCVVGKDLDAYIAAGVRSDHESVTIEEMLEKYNKGMYVILRRGSLAEPTSAKELLDQTGETERILLSTDGCITAQDMLTHGHMNYALAQIVAEGVEAICAIRMATLYPAKAYGLHNMGAIEEGYIANMAIVNDLENFTIRDVIVKGKPYMGNYKREVYPTEVMESIHRAPIQAKDLSIPVPVQEGHVKVNILKVVDGTLETLHEERILPVKQGELQLADDLMYCAVIDRYREKGTIGLGIISNAGKMKGALAGSIAQDTQNLIVFGDNIMDMAEAMNAVIESQGGVFYLRNGKMKAQFALPVLGILSQERAEDFTKEVDNLIEQVRLGGLTLSNPILTMSLQIALAVIPEMAITNRGLLDIVNHRFIPVCELV